jgi:hypothetical protein
LEAQLDQDPIGAIDPNNPDPVTQPPVTSGAACSVPSRPRGLGAIPARIAGHIEVIKHAMACDRTRVAALTFCPELAGGTPSWVKGWAGGPMHVVSHDQNSTVNATAKQAIESHTRLQIAYAQMFADLLAALDSVAEGPGTMLDNSIVVWGQPMSHGGRHVNWNIPVVVAGGANSGLNLGRYYKFGTWQEGVDWSTTRANWYQRPTESDRQPHNRLLVSIARAFGVNTDTVGDPRFKGGLPGFNV